MEVMFPPVSSLTISVIIRTYNRSPMVSRAVQCALTSIREGDEIIVVDDDFTDDTETVLAAYRSKIRYLRLGHGGAGKARNRGIQQARNSLVAFLDSDDEWMPGKLDLQRAFMEAQKDVLFCFSDFAVRDWHGREFRRYLANWHQDQRSWDEILGPGTLYSSLAALPENRGDFSVYTGDLYDRELTANYVFTSTLVVRRQEAGDALHFAEDVPTHEDWECFGRLARVGPAAYMDCETTWQITPKGPRLTDANVQFSAFARIVIIERVWGKDDAFLEQNRELYQRTLDAVRLRHVKDLLSSGQTREARYQARLLDRSPLSVRLLAQMPGLLVRGLLRIRGLLRGPLRPLLSRYLRGAPDS